MKEVLELKDNFAGSHISTFCEKAVALAEKSGKSVHFEFNGTHVYAQPGEDAKSIESRWAIDMEASAKAYRESPERIIEAAKRSEEERKAREAHMVEKASTEKEMRNAEVPWPKTPEQLSEYVDSLLTRDHSYGTCVYAASMAAHAAFNYVAGALGMTGFQAGCADMDILRRTRGMNGPFMIMNAEDALYPQYDLHNKLSEAMESWKPWMKEEAIKKLERNPYSNPDVIAHWKRLATMKCEENK